MEPGYAIAVPDGDGGVYALSNPSPSDSAASARTAFLDQYTGEVLAEHGWRDRGALRKVTSWGINTHMGREYGPVFLSRRLLGTGQTTAGRWAATVARRDV